MSGIQPSAQEAERLDLFPHPSVRPGQRELLRDVREALGRGEHLVAYAPTGLGKTAAALAGGVEVALEREMLLLFLTSRRTQHRIALETLRKMREKAEFVAVDVVAKQAMCPRPEAAAPGFYEWCSLQMRKRRCRYYTTQDPGAEARLRGGVLSAEEVVEVGRERTVCPYRLAMDVGSEARVVVGDYNLLFSEMLDATLRRLGRSPEEMLAVVDEAHNLPDRIRENYSGSMGPGLVREAAIEAGGVLRRPLEEWARRLERENPRAERRVEPGELTGPLEDVLGGSLRPLPLEEFMGQLVERGEEVLEQVSISRVMRVAQFIQGWRETPKCVHILSPGPEWSYRLLDAAEFSGPLFRQLGGSVLMSGTLHPPGLYADLLGIPEERRRLREYTSPFPPENRLVLHVPGVTTRYTERGDAMDMRIAHRLERICRLVPGNVVVFFPSYDQMERAASHIARGSRPLLMERSGMADGEKGDILRGLEEAREHGGALFLGVMGGSFSEGVDYEDNLLRAVVVVGIPFAPPSVETESLIAHHEAQGGHGQDLGYTLPALRRVLQASGRLIRSETDRGAILLLDERYPRYRAWFPGDFRFATARDEEPLLRAFFQVPGGRQRVLA
ncbi:MAG: ATP-dependent DNA helicase [Euryarchaeota archaeon]|nr:ATP-dependent DNA helicase [Euryarchaeota archaeon]